MPVERLLKDEATEEKGERARMASFVGAMAIADLVKTTLGPKGMDKILQSTGRGHNITITNDGATILKSLHIDNPAAKVLVDISKAQDDEVGDGTTSVVVLAGEFPREAEKLIASRIHPMTIIAGYRMAAECAHNALLQKAMDNKQDPEKFKSDLMKIAMTTLSSKILTQDKEHFAKLAVDAVLRLKGSTNLEAIQILKKAGGPLKDSFLDEGFILDKKIGIGQPKRIENAKILVANTAMDTDKVKIYGTRVRVDSMARVAEIESAEKEKMREKVKKIVAHGINCFVNRQLIYNFPEELFADAGILAIEHADFDGIERLALMTGGEITSTFDDPESVKLGHCKLIEEIMIGEDKLIHFSGVEMGEACTIVLRGARRHLVASTVSSFIFLQASSDEVILAEPLAVFREHIDVFDGYTFLYPKNWIQVKGAGADIFFRDPFILDENISVEISSPSSSKYKSVEDLGTPQEAAEKVLKQYLTEFMSTRLGVRRESNILSTSSRVADDGNIYYQVEVNIKSYANNNELAVMPSERIPQLEWDRRYLSILGVGNKRLYELRLQTPENVFLEEEKVLRKIMDSFRVLKSVD